MHDKNLCDYEFYLSLVGTFNGSSATQYCMAVSDSQLIGNVFNINNAVTMKYVLIIV